MTTEQIQQHYEVVFDGRGYLCIPPEPKLKKKRPLKPLPPPLRQANAPGRARVIEAMPGTLAQLVERSGVCKNSVHQVFRTLRSQGRLEQTARLGLSLTVYSLREQP